MIEKTETTKTWLDRAPIAALPWLTVEVLIFAVILVLAVISRFYDLGARVMSHDESLHTYFSYNYYRGLGYEHNPMMHGPLQFHLIALSYFIFGASDFSARIPAALFSVATIALVWMWRRYLGRAGALIAGAMALISPFLLYYGRYTREDPYVGVSLFLMLYAILRYFETGKHKYIYIIAGSLVIHYLTKETSYIYNAQILIFLALYFVMRVLQHEWNEKSINLTGFLVALTLSAVLFGATFYLGINAGEAAAANAAQTVQPADPATISPLEIASAPSLSPLLIVAVLMLLAMAATVFFLARGLGWQAIRAERAFDLLMVFGTLVLPHLSAIPVYMIGWNPLDYSIEGLLRTGMFLVPLILLSIVLGLWWNKDAWWRMAAIYWVPYILLYTSVFTNGQGFFTGVVGSLGYWLDQHDVQRGSQPLYYYLLITIPIYEFLPALASLVAVYYSFRKPKNGELPDSTANDGAFDSLTNFASLFGWWTFSIIAALSISGEKMPWLTFHMSLPMVLWGGWGLGRLVERIRWNELSQRKPLLTIGLGIVFILSLAGLFISLAGATLPFQGRELAQLQVTTSFMMSALGLVGSGWALTRLLGEWSIKQAAYLGILIAFGVLTILTTRTTIRANYLRYNSGQEYLVYAHGYTGVKDVLTEVKDLSLKTTGGMDIVVAYDDDVSWPMSWYMREFPNARFYGSSPTRDLREVPAIIVGDNNFAKIEPIVGNAFYRFDYIRMVWPNQDYFNLTTERLWQAVSDPAMRAAIFQVWLNGDFSPYASVTNNQSLTEANWSPSDRMRLYIRKDIAAKVWKYGSAPVSAEQADPYEKGKIQRSADWVFGSFGNQPGQFNNPRALAFAPDGSFYVADSRNHRIQHFQADGTFINEWGVFGDNNAQPVPAGALNEPWGITVSPDGRAIYVSDTWNSRIQKFSPDGRSIGIWGVFGLAETPNALYGPRGMDVDKLGRLFVADTGNKRIVIYSPDGEVLGQFGAEGAQPGEFYEPVDVKLDDAGNVYVTDTWNQRIQVFSPDSSGLYFSPLAQWDIAGWYSQSLDNKPYLAIAPYGDVFVSDPEGYRILQFTRDGQFVQTWGDVGIEDFAFGLPSGLEFDSQGNLWVADAGNHRLMRFSAGPK